MEKTIKYLLQEAYVDGYNDAREAVARDIENLEPNAADYIDTLKGKYWVARCADIARGKK